MAEANTHFPEAVATIDESERGLLHCEVGAILRYVEEQMDDGKAWYCERVFRFIESCLADADPELENAIRVSFIEDLALGKHSKDRYIIVKDRMPPSLRDKLKLDHDYWLS